MSIIINVTGDVSTRTASTVKGTFAMKIFYAVIGMALILSLVQVVSADTGVNQATQNDKAFSKYGLTGKGVIVAILDRGIDYAHPDFRNTDSTTRIRMMWDMSNVNPNLPI